MRRRPLPTQISEPQHRQLALALRIRTSIHISNRAQLRVWKDMEKKKLVYQLPSGNWLLTTFGWHVLRREDERCFGTAEKSPPCSSNRASLGCAWGLQAFDCMKVTTKPCKKVGKWRYNLRCPFGKYDKPPNI